MRSPTRRRIPLAAAPHLLFHRRPSRGRDTRGFCHARRYKGGRFVTMLTRETAPHLGYRLLDMAVRRRPHLGTTALVVSALYVVIATLGMPLMSVPDAFGALAGFRGAALAV